jgi:hypothetical protein
MPGAAQQVEGGVANGGEDVGWRRQSKRGSVGLANVGLGTVPRALSVDTENDRRMPK